jgi:1-acyl-sn-glycerol-3-phosphate acyltransferase
LKSGLVSLSVVPKDSLCATINTMVNWYSISPLILQKLIWVPTRLILLFFVRLDIDGLDNIKALRGNAIFACNHTSELDPILIPASLPFWSHFSPIFYTSREEEFYVRSGWRRHLYGGTFFKAWGAYPVFAGLRNYEKSLKHHISIVRAGGSICVFPEGHITRDGHIQPAKGGVAYLAHVTKVPIIPVRLDGAFRMSFSDFLLRRRNIRVSFGQPLYTIDKEQSMLSPQDFKNYGDFVMTKIIEMGK